MVINSTFNNISVILWRSVLLVEKTTDLSQVTVNIYHIMLCTSIIRSRPRRLWNTCACCNWRQHLQRWSPHGLHWPTVDEGLDTAALASVSLMLLGRRNATTAGSGNNLARPSSTVGQCKPFGDKRCNLVLSPIATRTSVP
jgi:hypothetical protein